MSHQNGRSRAQVYLEAKEQIAAQRKGRCLWHAPMALVLLAISGWLLVILSLPFFILWVLWRLVFGGL